jgi:hypothetical protein
VRIQLIVIFILFILGFAKAQSLTLVGTLVDSDGIAVGGALVALVEDPSINTLSDSLGDFHLNVNRIRNEYILVAKALAMQDLELSIANSSVATKKIYVLRSSAASNFSVVVKGKSNKEGTERFSAGGIYLDPKIPQNFISPFGDFNKVISSIGMGVSSNNELSGNYNVRGGNYDENLVYVNNMQIYRPFLAKTGQQEGLSFVNPDLVEKVSFYAGGWQARYGDKLSSVLDVKYKRPTKFKASASIGLLGGTGHVEKASKNKRFSFAIGARHKRAGYLLNTLPTKGEYKPRFYDVQGIINYDFLKTKDSMGVSNHYISAIYSWAYNDYRFAPTTRDTKFGTLSQPKTFTATYDGQEKMQYTTAQVGLMHGIRISPKVRLETVGYLVRSVEREYRDVMASYRLCDTDPDPSNQTFNQCLFVTGLGSDYKYSRNKLEATIGSVGERVYVQWNS